MHSCTKTNYIKNTSGGLVIKTYVRHTADWQISIVLLMSRIFNHCKQRRQQTASSEP